MQIHPQQVVPQQEVWPNHRTHSQRVVPYSWRCGEPSQWCRSVTYNSSLLLWIQKIVCFFFPVNLQNLCVGLTSLLCRRVEAIQHAHFCFRLFCWYCSIYFKSICQGECNIVYKQNLQTKEEGTYRLREKSLKCKTQLIYNCQPRQ